MSGVLGLVRRISKVGIESKNLHFDTDLGHLDRLNIVKGLGGYTQVK
jgi:hypothetical protein